MSKYYFVIENREADILNRFVFESFKEAKDELLDWLDETLCDLDPGYNGYFYDEPKPDTSERLCVHHIHHVIRETGSDNVSFVAYIVEQK